MSEPYYGWAVDAVNSLYWLKDVDERAFQAGAGPLGFDPRVVDVAHVRWATSTAITAVDLCIAELAVKLCGFSFWSDHLPDIGTVGKSLSELSIDGARPEIESATAWLDGLVQDADHKLLRRRARNPLMHGFLVRSAMIGGGRTPFELDPALPPQSRLDPPAIIALSITVAERQVKAFYKLIGPRAEPSPPRPQG